MSAAAIQTVMETLTAMMNNGNQVLLGALQILLQVQDGANFTADQLNWLINHQDVLKACSIFQYEYNGMDGIEDATQMLVEYVTKNQIEDLAEADFSRYGEDSANCGPCFAIAWTTEYAFLKRDDPGPNPSTDPWGAKAHSMKLGALATWKVLSTGVHLFLDSVGLIPVVGEIADLASGGIYLLEGEYVDATLSGWAALPIGGWASTGIKYARKTVTVGGNSTTLNMVVVDGLIKFGTDVYEGRKQLRRTLNTPYAHEAHHIVPWELRNHPVIQAAANARHNGAFHMNDILNGISLPNALGNSGLPQHLGSHPEYTERVRQSLETILELNPNISPEVALQKISVLAQNIKTKITQTSGGKINDVNGWITP